MELYIVGAGGVGRETLDVAMAGGVRVRAFLDDRLAGSVARGLAVLAPEEAPAGGRFVVGIAEPEARRRLAALLLGRGLSPATLVHPRAVVAPDTQVGPGCVIMAGAHVSSSVVLGAQVQVHYNATVGHDARLDDLATVYPGANLSGHVHLGQGATVGSGACVLQLLTVGAGAFVGAGAVVTHDVAAGSVVVGVPARPR